MELYALRRSWISFIRADKYINKTIACFDCYSCQPRSIFKGCGDMGLGDRGSQNKGVGRKIEKKNGKS